ncbi:MAG: hypothetical protein IKZ60_04905 [Bacteroidales bacterium]|nr:hypothetical protein [Bacteroidales bacterium]
MRLMMSLIEAVLIITGAGSPEELEESEMERFESLAANPVCINLASTARMRASGLFSDYQIASIQDYIGRTGDILSATELGRVPGFTPPVAQALALFLSFESHSPAGKRHYRSIRQDATARAVVKEAGTTLAGKYHLSYGERAEFYLSRRESTTASAVIYGKRPWKAVLGDFNARFGQGLLLWSGFSLSGFPSAGSFSRNGSGFSGTGSFSPSYRGICLDYSGRSTMLAAGATDSGALLASAGWHGRSASIGLNGFLDSGKSGFSADWKKGLGHLTLFGEAAWDDGAAALAGTTWAPEYKTSASILLRYYSPGYSAPGAGAVRSSGAVRDEAGIAAGFARKWLNCTVDMAVHPEKLRLRKKNYQQFKSVVNASPSFEWGAWQISPVIRWVERMQVSPSGDGYSAVWRHDLRLDLKASKGPLQGCLRLNGVQTADYKAGGLAYLELGYKTARDTARFQASIYLRGTICDTPNWTSRIYSYERDLPGCFTVPAWYGQKKGLSLIAGISYRTRRCRQRLYFRASTKDIKLQYQIWTW